MATGSKRISTGVSLQPATVKKIDEIASAEQRSRSQVIRMIIEKHFATRQPQAAAI